MEIQNELIKDFVDSLGLSNWELVNNCNIYITIEDINGEQLHIWQVFENIIVYNNDLKFGTYKKANLLNRNGHKVKKWVLL